MARYTCSFIVAIPLHQLDQALIEVLQSCRFDIIYQTPEYMMGREIPGQVSFAKLVTVEVLIDRTTATDREVRLNCVVKNEELPLQINNHCWKMFDVLKQAMSETTHWQLVESLV